MNVIHLTRRSNRSSNAALRIPTYTLEPLIIYPAIAIRYAVFHLGSMHILPLFFDIKVQASCSFQPVHTVQCLLCIEMHTFGKSRRRRPWRVAWLCMSHA